MLKSFERTHTCIYKRIKSTVCYLYLRIITFNDLLIKFVLYEMKKLILHFSWYCIYLNTLNLYIEYHYLKIIKMLKTFTLFNLLLLLVYVKLL